MTKKAREFVPGRAGLSSMVIGDTKPLVAAITPQSNEAILPGAK